MQSDQEQGDNQDDQSKETNATCRLTFRLVNKIHLICGLFIGSSSQWFQNSFGVFTGENQDRAL